MKLTPELLATTSSTLNPLKQRELELRGLKIPAIENLGVTNDQNDVLDLTDNDILALVNFPLLSRLTALHLSNNRVSRLDPRLAHSLPSLETLVLTNNALPSLASLAPLGKFPRLTYLSLTGNPAARLKYYREWVIHTCPSVRVLDFARIRDKERAKARELFKTTDGRPTALAVSLGKLSSAEAAAAAAAKTFTPGEAGNADGAGAAGRLLTAEERKAIEEAIEASESLDEIKKLEERLRSGYTSVEDLKKGAGKTKAA